VADIAPSNDRAFRVGVITGPARGSGAGLPVDEWFTSRIQAVLADVTAAEAVAVCESAAKTMVDRAVVVGPRAAHRSRRAPIRHTPPHPKE
jgi:hypothetical protein